jgi:AraC-like DNA-binding protein
VKNVTERLNDVIDYIENHLTDKIEQEAIARIACCSYYDAGRMFSLVTGLSMADYIRNRRLALAGEELKTTRARVIDVALKYQYDSPVSFSRAFQKFHGFSPSCAYEDRAILKQFPRLIYQIRAKEVQNMIRKDILCINGKDYEAAYFGERDISGWSDYASKREYWRLENVGDDFKDCRKDSEVLPYNNYPPIAIEVGQVFVIDYHKKEGGIDRRVYLADGTVWQGLDSTRRLFVND